jgi:protein-S-isoprenylcysteine O-methyltransferase Ste14
MKYIVLLSYLFFASEFILMLSKHSKKKTTKQKNDKGSLFLLWGMITLCMTFGFLFAKHGEWESANYVVAVVGLFFVLVGVMIRWASILQLKKAFTVDVAIGDDHSLKMDGIYKLVRHPSYLGLYLILLGFSICMNSVFSLLVVAIPMFFVLFYRIVVEEKALIGAFGEKYLAYRARTSRMIPWIF